MRPLFHRNEGKRTGRTGQAAGVNWRYFCRLPELRFFLNFYGNV
jgi:hypothetical protein